MPDLLDTGTIVPFQERYLADARARPRIGTIVSVCCWMIVAPAA
jgi:hypothetical protein